MEPVPKPLAPGDHFEHYEVLDKLGEGGFATVHRVRDGERQCALKLSHNAVGLDDGARRALREIEVLRSLTNRHVVRIHAAGIADDGRVYIAMELLSGGPLGEHHDLDQPMAPLDALRWMHQACMGLAEAHALGIVHRDLKPENLWIEPSGTLKVIDFGLARAWDGVSGVGANVTLGGFLVGTPHYMQPEQTRMQRLTPAGDVYSLATILYELLTGHSVYFDDAPLSQVRARNLSDPVTWLDAHTNRSPIPLSRYPGCRDLPPSVPDLVARCLAKDPAERPADAVALSTELGTILHYEYGVLPGAMVRVLFPYGTQEERLLLPGTHRIGADPACEIVVRGRGVQPVHALLEWDGPGDFPRVRPLGEQGPVLLDGVRVRLAAQLRADSRIQIGELGLAFDDAP